MKPCTFSPNAHSESAHRHRVKDRIALRSRCPRPALHNHKIPNLDKTILINKIGDQIVGMARLVQNGPHTARVVLFRIDPQWCHTKVTLKMIESIQTFCQIHGHMKVTMSPRIVPHWLLPVMNNHGFKLVN